MGFGITDVAAITAICYLAGIAAKATSINNKFIPSICGVIGGALGVLALIIQMPEFPATDYITAAAVGIVSGLAATGVDQIGKQLAKEGE